MTDTPATGPGGRTPGPTHAAATGSNPAGTLLPLGAGRGRPLTVGSLFSGIGGLDLGLERAGMTVKWQSEIDPYACRVLAKHWPHVPNLGDITTIDWSQVEPVDLICGGYPCQPFSLAGVRRGASDPRHLWPHFARSIRLLRPRHALLENVPGHLSMGFGRVLGDLAELGYDTEWDCIPAAAVGAPHLRYRVFVVCSDTNSRRLEVGPQLDSEPLKDPTNRHPCRRHADGFRVEVADSAGCRPQDQREPSGTPTPHSLARGGCAHADVADAEGKRRSTLGSDRTCETWTNHVARHAGQLPGARPWEVEPDVGRVAHGIPSRVDRLRCLGNAVVPQVAEWIGRRIVEAAA